ncbi:MAG: hypothetical protein H6980_03335 [Gammaproteobacteria bacterium]|nr:hypothetical protein [Gammaproteobacteria bacterium]
MEHLLDPSPAEFGLALASLLAVLGWRMKRGNFLALLIGLGVAVGGGELMARALDIGIPVSPPTWEEHYAEPAEPWAYRPSSPLRYRYADNPRGYFDPDNSVRSSINAEGFRGPLVARHPPKGVTRIAVLGDSFTLGIGVRDADTLPAQLQKRISDGGRMVEVLNFGISGSDTARQVELLEKRVLDFNPDVVLIVLFLNDAERAYTIPYLSRAAFWKRLRTHSHLLNALIRDVERARLHRRMVDHYREGYRDEAPGWLNVRDALLHAHALTQARGMQLAIAIYPILVDLDTEYPFADIHRTIRTFANQAGIASIDLLDGLRGRRAGDLWVHPSDQHPNEVAQGIAADVLAKHFDGNRFKARSPD